MKISIVIPVYRDTDALPELLDQLFLTATQNCYNANVILVDDGSQNDTWARLIDIKKSRASKHITLLRLAHNSGQQAATICGLIHCNTDIAITMDSDLQHSPKAIPLMLEEIFCKNIDVVYGVPEKNHHPLLRQISSLIFKAFTQPLSVSATTSSSFRGIRKSVMHDLKNLIWSPGHSIDAFLKSKTSLIHSIKINHAPRRHGLSTYTWRALFIRAIKELYYSGRSGAVYTLAGLSALLIGSIQGFQAAIASQSYEISMALKSIHFFTGGIIFILFGIHLSNAGNHRSRQPIFIIAEKIE
jgi:polyisoprenyl-phosphate glycosyltransferase